MARAADRLSFFFLGCVFSGLLVREGTLDVGPGRYGIALACESVLLFAATYLLVHGQGGGRPPRRHGLRAAGGERPRGELQRRVIRTPPTSPAWITDLGLAAGSALRRDRVDGRRVGLYLLLTAGFIGGSVLGGLGYVAIGFYTLLFPATLTGAAGLGLRLLSHPPKPDLGANAGAVPDHLAKVNAVAQGHPCGISLVKRQRAAVAE